jgi:predicted HTH transcriptional regulator
VSDLTRKELEFNLKSGEGLKVEFKESPNHIDRTMVAFANAEGGSIFLGINDKKEIVGIETTNSLKSRIQDVARNCDPPVNISFDNPGGLVKGITVRDLGRKSRTRNPLIADLFYRVNLAERIGSGIKRMGDLMRNNGSKAAQN